MQQNTRATGGVAQPLAPPTTPHADELILPAPPAAVGQRLDRWLTELLPDHSRSEVQRWIEQGCVRVDGSLAKASLKLTGTEVVQVQLPPVKAISPVAAEAIPLTILYEDADLLVVDKPAGMVVHPAPGHTGGTLVNAVLHHCPDLAGVGGERRPGIVHRLDKETSGLILVAKHDQAHRALQAQFKARTVYKEYLALVEGQLTPPQGRINAPIGRHPTDRLRQAVLLPDPVTGAERGRPATTDYRVLAVYSAPVRDGANRAAFSLVSAVIHTGRTHQIRVHLAWRKHPVVGDALYGLRQPRLPLTRQFLHAHRLRFTLPSGEMREFSSPLPADLQGVFEWLERVDA